MNRNQSLVAVSAVQLAAALSGLGVAIRRRRAYDVPMLHGDPTTVKRDAVWMGTAYSAPAYMLVTQAVGIAVLGRGKSERAAVALGVLGGLMVPGYLGEAQVRRHLSRGGFDPLETPLVVVGLAGAAGMAVLGLRR